MHRTTSADQITLKQKPAAGAPAGWVKALDRSDAQIAAGQTIPLEPMLDELRASIARMEAKRARATGK
jgi:hypothetical protein